MDKQKSSILFKVSEGT